jgi:hypothetical protein
MTDLEKLASKYVDEKSDTDGFYDAFIAGYEAALRIHDVVGRSEQLTAFAEYCDEEHGLFIPSWMIDGYNKSR